MLQITLPAVEAWDEEKQEFVSEKEYVLQLEHSLVSVSKWESKWCKPFMSNREKTSEEILDYVRCMTLNKNAPISVYNRLTRDDIFRINEYIAAPMTATTFSKDKSGHPSREQVTAELVYYWMIAQNIPFECQKWHLNRLLTLIKVCSIKNSPPTKHSKREIMSRNAALNAARRKQLHTSG